MDGCATLFSHSLELPIIMYRTSALSVIGEESICNHLRFWGFSIFSASAKTEGSDETVRVQSI